MMTHSRRTSAGELEAGMEKGKSQSGLQKWIAENHVLTFPNQRGEIAFLDLRNDATTDRVLGMLHELPTLQRLTLQGTRITDVGLAQLVRLPGLEELDLRSCKNITDAGMKDVARLAGLKALQLYDTAIGDEGLGELVRLQLLEELNLHTTRVTDAGLGELAAFKKLRKLELGGPGQSDAGLRSIGVLGRLEWLLLGESAFTDEGLSQLGALAKLTHLYMASTPITGTGFEQLAGLKKLECIHAPGSAFFDLGLKHLMPLSRLKSLCLCKTQVTDKGIGHLEKLLRLKNLNLEETRVTLRGKTRLKAALPRCVITISTDRSTAAVERFDEAYFRSHPPRCLKGFRPKPLQNEPPTSFRLICRCSSETGTALGHPLSKLNDRYTGSEFVGPLSFRCGGCGKSTPIIDTEAHGYDGEAGNSVTLRGRGKPTPFRCAACESQAMTVIVRFDYEGEAKTLVEDDPSIAAEDFFTSFSAEGICANCKARETIAAFECA